MPMMLPEKKIKKNFSPRKTNKQFNRKDKDPDAIAEANEEIVATPNKTPTKSHKKESAQKETRKAIKKMEKESKQ
jgi:hypothetical protein